MDRGLARLCWRCPGLRLHSTQAILRFIHGGEDIDTLNKNCVLDDRGASSTEDLLMGQYLRNGTVLVLILSECWSSSDKEGWEKSSRIMEDFGQARSEASGPLRSRQEISAGKCINYIGFTHSSYDNKACLDCEAGLFGHEARFGG